MVNHRWSDGLIPALLFLVLSAWCTPGPRNTQNDGVKNRLPNGTPSGRGSSAATTFPLRLSTNSKCGRPRARSEAD